EYGLTPDDVHDSFNFFMNTEIGADGRATITRQSSKAGDFVELLALTDVLAVPNVCGADIMRTSNFSLKPIRLEIHEAAPADMAAVPPTPILRSQRVPADFRQPNIKADRELYRDPGYQPVFTNVPLRVEELAIVLDEDEAALFDAVRLPLYGDDEGAALRDVLFSWWEETYLAASSGAPAIGKR
ncbi:MAG: DUF1989 domain-containing protein, partial [Devosia sp.]